MEKRIGIIGLGSMGFNMTQRLAEKGWEVHGFDANTEKREAAMRAGGLTVHESMLEMAGALPLPRLIWIMVPHQFVDEVLADLLRGLDEGDAVIDGGNSHYKETIRRVQKTLRLGVKFIDVGVSGGPEGARNGACLMVGGDRETFLKLEDLWRDLAVDGGYAHFDGIGAGHYVKMVHNGIEYGMMQAIAEGFSLMRRAAYEYDLKDVAGVYRSGSVIASRLMDWLAEGYEQYGTELEGISGTVEFSGEGAWTVEAAHESGVPVPIIEQSQQFREESQKNPSYTGKILSMLRNMFGGHKAMEDEVGGQM